MLLFETCYLQSCLKRVLHCQVTSARAAFVQTQLVMYPRPMILGVCCMEQSWLVWMVPVITSAFCWTEDLAQFSFSSCLILSVRPWAAASLTWITESWVKTALLLPLFRLTHWKGIWSWSWWELRACVKWWSAAGWLLCRRPRWWSWWRSTRMLWPWQLEMVPTMSAWSKVSDGQQLTCSSTLTCWCVCYLR